MPLHDDFSGLILYTLPVEPGPTDHGLLARFPDVPRSCSLPTLLWLAFVGSDARADFNIDFGHLCRFIAQLVNSSILDTVTVTFPAKFFRHVLAADGSKMFHAHQPALHRFFELDRHSLKRPTITVYVPSSPVPILL
ncbi:hypothetical protein EXIGLDRAFT_763172 [Exidia glandulosa HHB12029]|uniref:Uncharacterized protein n=1 Tax=Exidia glandulosa HHB12029 TaxID=1314781 RepID=A0A165M9B6_EXIGL|nr:hypothetical protein EXIGLDRAFT_763172 [Exidia glandulosa HHB12029]